MEMTIAGVKQLGGEELEITLLPEKHTSIFTTHWLRENCYCINTVFTVPLIC